jgi:hypothetical protein
MGDHEDELFTGGGKSDSFVSYLTTITPVEKNELLNVFQYILLAIIPLVLFLKFMKEYIPPENPTKSTIEITTEVVIQLFLIFVVFWLIHKVILYIPTYSNTPYEKLNMIQLILPVLFLLFCMKSSISEKMSLLLERAFILMGLKTEGMEEEPKKQSQRPQGMQGQPNMQMNMPNMNMPNMNMPQMNMPMNTSTQQESREVRDLSMPMNNMNMNYGIQEPVAANEMGGSFVNY